MSIKVRRVETLAGYRLALRFSDGTNGIADLSEHVQRAPFLSLQNEHTFQEALLDHGAVEWPTGGVGIATEALYALVHTLPRPITREQAQQNELQVSLAELRRLVGKTQAEVAHEVGIEQGSVSLFERDEDHKLSHLRKYVRALGAELEVVAVIGDKRLTLHGI